MPISNRADLLSKIDDLLRRGDISSAEKLLGLLEAQQCLGGREVGEGIQAYYRAWVLMSRGLYGDAVSVAQAAFDVFRKHKIERWIARGHLLLTSICLRLGRYTEARRHAEAAVHYYTCRVLIPGLVFLHGNHNYPFLGSDRLWTVPRLLGREHFDGINHYPHPFP